MNKNTVTPNIMIQLPTTQTFSRQSNAERKTCEAFKDKTSDTDRRRLDDSDAAIEDRERDDRRVVAAPASKHEETKNTQDIVTDFEDMGLKPMLLRGIYAYGFERPSAIQQRAIIPIVKRKDTMAQAHSGSGKTATFTIGTLQVIDTNVHKCQALILANTRELANQISRVVENIGMYMKVRVRTCVGGTSTRADIQEIRKGVHIVVGTPGRVKALIRDGHLKLNACEFFCLDEADEMLSYGFLDDVRDIFQYLPESVQVGLFSATMPTEVLDVSKKIMRDPVRILVKKEELTLDGIKQFFINCERQEYKVDCLEDLYDDLKVTQGIIFCKSRRSAQMLADTMRTRGKEVTAMHGEMEQRERTACLRDFRSGKIRILVATDLLARGIDVQQVSLVVNFDLPSNRENYIHRIGRSGRFGRKGVAVNLISNKEEEYMHDLAKFYATEITEMPTDFATFL